VAALLYEFPFDGARQFVVQWNARILAIFGPAALGVPGNINSLYKKIAGKVA